MPGPIHSHNVCVFWCAILKHRPNIHCIVPIVGGYICSTTDTDGRCNDLLTDDQFSAGTYKLTFNTGEYFKRQSTNTFYPFVEVGHTFIFCTFVYVGI